MNELTSLSSYKIITNYINSGFIKINYEKVKPFSSHDIKWIASFADFIVKKNLKFFCVSRSECLICVGCVEEIYISLNTFLALVQHLTKKKVKD